MQFANMQWGKDGSRKQRKDRKPLKKKKKGSVFSNKQIGVAGALNNKHWETLLGR